MSPLYKTFGKDEAMKIFKTPDMYLFAFLVTRGYHVHKIVKDKRRCVFHVEDQDSRPQDVKDYYNNVPVGVANFKNALLNVRNMIRDMGKPGYASWSRYEDVKK